MTERLRIYSVHQFIQGGQNILCNDILYSEIKTDNLQHYFDGLAID